MALKELKKMTLPNIIKRIEARFTHVTLKICCNLSIEQYYWYQIIPAPHKKARIDTDPLSTKRQSTLLEKVWKPRDWSYRFEIGQATLNLYFVPLEFLDFFLRLTNWSYDVYSTYHKLTPRLFIWYKLNRMYVLNKEHTKSALRLRKSRNIGYDVIPLGMQNGADVHIYIYIYAFIFCV